MKDADDSLDLLRAAKQVEGRKRHYTRHVSNSAREDFLMLSDGIARILGVHRMDHQRSGLERVLALTVDVNAFLAVHNAEKKQLCII